MSSLIGSLIWQQHWQRLVSWYPPHRETPCWQTRKKVPLYLPEVPSIVACLKKRPWNQNAAIEWQSFLHSKIVLTARFMANINTKYSAWEISSRFSLIPRPEEEDSGLGTIVLRPLIGLIALIVSAGRGGYKGLGQVLFAQTLCGLSLQCPSC